MPTATPITSVPVSPTAFPTVVPDPPINQHAHHVGYRTLWIGFVLMAAAAIGFIVMSWSVPAAKRLYHSITTLIVVIAALSYFAMATGIGHVVHHIVIPEHHVGNLPDTFRHINRQIFYARYIDWVLTTPLLLLDLSLLAGLNGATIFTAVSADVVMVLSGLFATFAPHKGAVWGWYGIACIAYLWVLYTLVFTGRSAAGAKGATVSKFYTSIALYTVILWTAYPVIWALGDGTRILSVDAEIIAYTVLDVLAKVGFGVWLLLTHKRVPESHVAIGGFWTYGLNHEGRIRVGEGENGA